ncbi:hypoxanthine-guanine phosphoribosyltransferase [Thiohalophilus sp.]|uniref:hypoxanthine-guanine phosphoribosyltransferase n=1 Tax=Thiohalophilus sp. TaxID=3028392 RepID=UPI002ACE9C48|nr:hypoxanthine-guanine phosphoribosyltransferase [Thiohalophilus sp.]MDZ7663116.1 hypoxanthine-guanine phosphoribosyltransferase [Thiohalophilus sp.]MDZ7805063.1 hypoxanthine-guanine phosphoribosyltransferase [Thiohalophilus sp.]
MNINTVNQTMNEADCLYDQQQVEAALDKMAAAMTQVLKNSDPLVLCVLTGAIIPAGHLLTRLNFPLQIDYIHATRYAGGTSGGDLNWQVRPTHPLAGRNILIIDDILDEGITLAAIMEHCRAEGATEVYSAVLVEKMHDRKNGLQADFVGLRTEDRYLFGYGMDYKGYLRNAPGIYAVKGL